MLKRIALVCSAAVLLLTPVFAAADTNSANAAQLVPLYTQLVALLEQEIGLLQNPGHASLSIWPSSGVAPLMVTFILNDSSGTEAIDFGDGHSTGSNGCLKNAQGWCDLSKPIGHTYEFPGTYTVTLYDHPSATSINTISTSTITATGPYLSIPL